MQNIKHILYLDDDFEDLEIVQAAIAGVDQSVSIHTEQDPYRALNYLQDVQPIPDVILVDINMPVMSGFEFCEKIKTDKRTKHLPLVIYSTSSESIDIENAKRVGALGFIKKASSFSALREALSFLIGKSKHSGNSLVQFFI